MSTLKETVESLEKQLRTDEFIDVGKGTHEIFGISQPKFQAVIGALITEGFQVFTIKTSQEGAGKGGYDKIAVYKVLTRKNKAWTDARQAVRDGKLQTATKEN